MRLRNLFALMFICVCASLNAQELLKIRGKVLSSDNKPVEYTTISLESTEEGVVAEGATDAKGDFVVEAQAGEYILVIEPMGYDVIEKQLSLTSALDLGTFSVKGSQTVSLDAAVVTAEKPIYKVELDKKVYDMANDPMSQGQSLSDALANVPSVQVDAEGNVSLRGNDNVKFLIDGKPSGMLGVSSVADALKNIPAENVERIELVTNPSARYEASGSAGIINIVLKKGSNAGFNGSVTLNGGIPTMIGGNVNLNYKTKKYNIYTTLGSRYADREGEGSAFMTSFNKGTDVVKQYRSTDRDNNRIRRNYNIRLGGEYYLDDKNTVGLSAGYRYNNGNNNALVDYNYFDNAMTFLKNEYNLQDEKEIENNFDFDLNYKHEFDKKGHEFVFTGRFSSQKEDEDGLVKGLTKRFDNTTNSYVDEFSNRITDNLEDQKNVVITADYVRPIGEKGKFELGARADFSDTKTNNRTYFLEDNGNYVEDDRFFANIDNQQNVLAAYTQYGNAIGEKFQYFAGLRVESSDMKIKNYTTGENISKKYTDLFPTLTLNYKFTDKNEMQLSYSRRVRRPMGFMLMPFFSATDDRNVRNGNPDLNPTYTNSLELSYIASVGKLMVTPSLFYQRTTDMINQFQRKNINDSGEDVFITKPINAGEEDRYGLDLTATYKPARWWNLMLNVNLFGYKRTGYYEETNEIKDPETGIVSTQVDAQDFSGDGFSSRGRLSSNFTLPADFKIQVAGNYMGSMKTAQQKIEDNLSMDFSLSKDLFNKQATLSLNVRDVFNSRKREMTQYGSDYINYQSMRWMKRSINLSFTYRFKNTNEKDRNRQRPEAEEMGEEMQM
ncbi:TonB-dependent receptor [Empedobacter sp. 225-1]|uniref:outer membrane beta-barrel family protein n=1 Tax=Empedobacter sp. 225-1 TaxID=2746725 RepID=UPI0025760D47|nr:outer membrane beta-barrel family protein [Empedobacter sp. 225-1]MDM1522644.1 TonB-dependent receptor [Empedobacter sp. 225-1]